MTELQKVYSLCPKVLVLDDIPFSKITILKSTLAGGLFLNSDTALGRKFSEEVEISQTPTTSEKLTQLADSDAEKWIKNTDAPWEYFCQEKKIDSAEFL